VTPGDRTRRLVHAGIGLEVVTLGWNVVGVVILAILAARASSVALLGFGLDSVIEISASTVVIWELTGIGERRQRIALRMIGAAFALLATYLLAQAIVALATNHRATVLAGGVAWTGLTAVAMGVLAYGKRRVGHALGDPVLITEGRVTLVDALLATSVLAGILLDGVLGWWWADPMAGLVIVAYAVREAIAVFRA
jgi:hypothetical protein